MELVKWSTILLYWIWLDIRNISDNHKRHEWKLFVQILINTAVILIIIMENRENFIRLMSYIGECSLMAYDKVCVLITKLKG